MNKTDEMGGGPIGGDDGAPIPPGPIQPQYHTAREFYDAQPMAYHSVVEQIATQIFIHGEGDCLPEQAFYEAHKFVDYNIAHKDAFIKEKGIKI